MAGLDLEELRLSQLDPAPIFDNEGGYIVILYDDDYHGIDEVVSQVQIATGYDIQRCVEIMLTAHTTGRAIAYSGDESECERVAGVLRRIRLQVETDRL